MTSLSSILGLVHVIGLILGAGAATVKLVLLIRCSSDATLIPAYLRVSRPITKLIILGMILLTVSGVAWLVAGYGLTPLLVVKLALVAAIWVLGPVIDNAIEPGFRSLAPESGAPESPAFVRARHRYLALETLATLLFYVIIVMWLAR